MFKFLIEKLTGIPIHCGKPMQWVGRYSNNKGKYYTRYKCVKCGIIRNIKG